MLRTNVQEAHKAKAEIISLPNSKQRDSHSRSLCVKF